MNTYQPLPPLPTSTRAGDNISVVLVDGHVLVRQGMKEILQAQSDMVVVGEAGDSDSAIATVRQTRPNVVLFDIDMWEDQQVTVTIRKMTEISPESRIIVVSMRDEPEILNVLLPLGIKAYLVKTVGWQLLASVIRGCCAQGNYVVLVASRRSLPSPPTDAKPKLSPRELEVLELVSRARSNVQIAAHLLLSEATVKRHLRNIFIKLGAVSRIDAVNKAITAGLIGLPTARHDH